LTSASQIAMQKEPGSFRDPAGGIFYQEKKVYRWVLNDSDQFYQTFVSSDFFQKLVRTNYFIPTWITDPNNNFLFNDPSFVTDPTCKIVCFEHERLEFLSYPYEWTFAMLKDAAQHTLDLQQLLLHENLSLKDATPYNIQFRFTQPVFIDLCSIENMSRNGIWIAYNQFCQMFLYPLLKMTLNSSDSKAIFLSHLDGLTLDETVQSLGFRPFFKYGLLIDYLIPAFITILNRYKATNISEKRTVSINRSSKHSGDIQLHFIRRLKRTLRRIRLKASKNGWGNYAGTCSYGAQDSLIKSRFVEKILEINRIKNVLDIGCNSGRFSIMAAQKGCRVVALDSDHDCINSLYILSKEKKYSILPLWMSISNPSPAIGWRNTERSAFIKRYKDRFDCVFALALIHHLMITHRVPLAEIGKFFQQLTIRYLVVEYVGPRDIMFRKLLKYRQEDYTGFNQSSFEGTMSDQFSILEKSALIDDRAGMERCLYLMERKS
jgi:2-polyprenyl-3-methyl-5-hydroxy-6-metoxy-1,4-benzoquinol methylase